MLQHQSQLQTTLLILFYLFFRRKQVLTFHMKYLPDLNKSGTQILKVI